MKTKRWTFGKLVTRLRDKWNLFALENEPVSTKRQDQLAIAILTINLRDMAEKIETGEIVLNNTCIKYIISFSAQAETVALYNSDIYNLSRIQNYPDLELAIENAGFNIEYVTTQNGNSAEKQAARYTIHLRPLAPSFK